MPSINQVFDVDKLNAQGYIEVVFNDVNGVGLNVGSIIDDEPEFELSGPSAANVRVNGRPKQVNAK